ncbi:MAG: methyltransferase domain-containing protein [Candidatus Acidiferrales bacterium]
MWNDAVGYENYVGHWSRAIAPRFLAWLALPTGLRWLDVACGTGALTGAILAGCEPKVVVGLDGSLDYLAAAQANCREARVRFVGGDANELSFRATYFDVAVSGLALNFIRFERALAEQQRTVRAGGTIAAYVWDYAGEYEFARRFWDAALSVDPRAAAYDPGRKATICREHNLRDALEAAGCSGIETCVFDGHGEFPSREAYWHAFDGRQGSTSEYLALLTDEQRLRLRASLLSTMNAQGPVKLKIRALAVKGVRKS